MSGALGGADAGGGDAGGGDAGGGDAGGGGFVVTVGSGAARSRPIGVSAALAFEAGEEWWRGHKWPPGGLVWPNMPAGVEYPRRAWSPFHFSLVVLAEFVGTEVAQEGEEAPPLTWDTLLTTAANPFPTGAALQAELADLVALAEYRPGVMAEALAQRNDIIGYFRGVLSFNRASHPATFDLCWAALTVGQFQAMHYKSVFRRPRPSHISPSVMPSIDPPGHPSYPSGHATEAYLIALCLEQVMPAEIAQPAAANRPLRRMADRIARNREVLGVHYRSDSEIGRTLAERSLPILLACPSVATADTGLLAVAQGEWGA